MEELRSEMENLIITLGTLNPKTIEVSQRLDLLIVEEMKGYGNHKITERK